MLLAVVLTNWQASGFVESTHWSVKIAAFLLSILAVFGYTTKRTELKKEEVRAKAATIPPPIANTEPAKPLTPFPPSLPSA